MIRFKHTSKELLRVGKLVVKGLQEELKNQKHVASGTLLKSFKVRAKRNSGVLNIETNKLYWNVLQNPKTAYTVSIRAIQKWIQSKGGKSGFPTDNEGVLRTAILIYSKLKNKFYGKPYVFWTEGNNLRRTDFAGFTARKFKSKIAEELAPSIGKDVADMISRNIKNNTKLS